jgi:hypothetical protein
MSALPPIKRITREDLKDAPDWINYLLYPLNLFLDSVYGSLNKSLTFDTNILSQSLSFNLVAGASASANTGKFLLTMKSKPRFLFLTAYLSGGDYFVPSFTWNYDGTYINITSISSLTNGSTYNFKGLIIGD